MMRFLVALVVSLAASAAVADPVLRSCDQPEANARYVSLPWDKAAEVYEDGAIRFVSLSTGDPACCGAHLMVLFPDAPESLEQSCYLVSADEDGRGFGTVTFDDADPTLTPDGVFTMHLKPEIHDGQTFRKSDLAIRIDMNDWSVGLE